MMGSVLHRLRNISGEGWAVALFGASFLVGVWYAFPMVNTITDVWAFGGGVLRAMEAHTLLPGYGVAYGTLSFYQNYLFMALALLLGFVAVGFDLTALKTALVLNPSYSLLVPRIVSALTATVLLVIVYQFLKTQISSQWWRLTLLVLVFGNVLIAILVRSGKMWMLSLTFGMISFIYLYHAITKEADSGRPGRFAFVSIIAAFLATANFSFFAIFLVTVPILLYVFPRTPEVLKRLSLAVVFGAAVFCAVFALNAENTIEQVSGFVLQFLELVKGNVSSAGEMITPFESFIVNARQAIEAFPLLLLALIPAALSGIRDRPLAFLAIMYSVVYLLAVSVIFRSDHGLMLNVRHIAPLGFFLLFLLAACKPPARLAQFAFLTIGLAIYVYTLVLLSIPTTYNAASDFVANTYGEKEIRIDEHIWEFTLPMNKASYGLFASVSCGSTCQHMKVLSEDIAFRPTVVTIDTDPAMRAQLPPPDVLVVERAIDGCTPIARFGNNVPDDEIFDIDINLGRMLKTSFYSLKQLGKNIYIYETKDCAGATALTY